MPASAVRNQAARLLRLLDVLDVLRVFGRRLGDVNRPASDQRTARHSGGQFRNGHTNRHSYALSFPVVTGIRGGFCQHALCHQKRRELLKRQRC
jgi:hypothetical protein